MTDFLTSSACHGQKPKAAFVAHYHSRNNLLTKLIRNRQSVRFLVAPSLFGKTGLAAEYAETVFSFEQVFWIKGQSTCFFRDLDKGIMGSTLLSMTSEHALVVLDGLPQLNETRQALLSEMLKLFLSRSWEVIITTASGYDYLESLCEQSFYLEASDLLLSDNEIDACRNETEISRRLARSFSCEERIPGLFWSDHVDHDRMLCSIVKAGFSDRTLLVLFLMAVLRQGDFDDIALFVEDYDGAEQQQLKDYLYLGIRVEDASFTTHAFPLETVAKAFSSKLGALTKISVCSDKDTLITRLADLLLVYEEAERACMLMRNMASSPRRTLWLAERSHSLFMRGCIMPAHLLHESLHTGRASQGGLLLAFEAWRLIVLGEKEKSMRSAVRLYHSDSSSSLAVILSCLLVMRYGNSEQAAQACESFKRLGSYSLRNSDASELSTLMKYSEDNKSNIGLLVEFVAEGYRQKQKGFLQALDFLRSCAGEVRTGTAISILLVWMAEEMKTNRDQATFLEVASFASEHIRKRKESETFCFFDALLVISFEQLFEEAGQDVSASYSFSGSVDTSRFETSLFAQRKAYQKEQRFLGRKKELFRHTHPDELRKDEILPKKEEKTIPKEQSKLRVNLLGGLEVFIDGVAVKHKLFSRQKVKTLLALLILQQGRELSRERLCYLLWPESDAMSAQRNLYSVWSLLKKALSLSSGLCPFLIRTQFSYKMDSEIVTSDVSDLVELCQNLQFGELQGKQWSSVFAQLNNCFMGELLPTETKNNVINQARKDLRYRLVDALAIAALRQYESRDFQTALLLTHAVLSYDASREDMYTLLMQIQISLGQRTAALDTFFRCRKYLAEQLGIDPSSKTHSLYLQIIEEEPLSVLPQTVLHTASKFF